LGLVKVKLSKNTDLTHLDGKGMPGMVDVGVKQVTRRSATAAGKIRLPNSLKTVQSGEDFVTSKGSVLQTAIVAGTQAVKRTADLIPFCHPLPIEKIRFKHSLDDSGLLTIECEVEANYKTGVEMEALTGVSVALLTVYDMCKSAGQDMEISEIKVIRKRGGKTEINRE
jgi:cyclic pyranopterin phosphate synthase